MGINERKAGEFRFSKTITNSSLVAWPIEMQLGDTKSRYTLTE